MATHTSAVERFRRNINNSMASSLGTLGTAEGSRGSRETLLVSGPDMVVHGGQDNGAGRDGKMEHTLVIWWRTIYHCLSASSQQQKSFPE